jgi:hypothetical protein
MGRLFRWGQQGERHSAKQFGWLDKELAYRGAQSRLDSNFVCAPGGGIITWDSGDFNDDVLGEEDWFTGATWDYHTVPTRASAIGAATHVITETAPITSDAHCYVNLSLSSPTASPLYVAVNSQAIWCPTSGAQSALRFSVVAPYISLTTPWIVALLGEHTVDNRYRVAVVTAEWRAASPTILAGATLTTSIIE